MSVAFSFAVRNSLLDLIADLIDGGGSAGTLNFYDGVQPVTGGTVTNLLCTVPLAYPCTSDAAAFASLSLTAPAAVLPSSAGTTTWARLKAANGYLVADLSVGASGSGADITVGSTALTTSTALDVQSITLTAGNAGEV